MFFKANNRPVDIKIWGDIIWSTKIWFPMLLAYLLGALPFWIMARATRWRMKRKLENTERALVAATAAPATPLPAVTDSPVVAPSLSPTGPA